MEGMGREIVAELQKTPQLPIQMLLTWHFTEFNGRRLLKDLLEDFEKVEMLEHYGQYYKLRVPKGEKTIGFLFGLLERISEASNVSEYSASQTTLEQIFNGFATEGDETKKIRTVFYSQAAGGEGIREGAEEGRDNDAFNKKKTLAQINN